MEIRDRACAMQVGPEDCVVLSSQNAVALGPDGLGRHAYCVGQKTAALAEAKGWQVVHWSETATALVARIIADAPTCQLVHLSGAHRRVEIAEALVKDGLRARTDVIYDQDFLAFQPDVLDLWRGERRIIAPLFSPRGAGQFARQAPHLDNVTVIALSAAVARAVAEAEPAQVIVSSAPNGLAMAEAIENTIGRTS